MERRKNAMASLGPWWFAGWFGRRNLGGGFQPKMLFLFIE